ncbi:MAG: hypothetical protein AAFP78_04300 [Pseudomonadota bacterium]
MPFESLDECVIVNPKRGGERHRRAARKAAKVRSGVRRRFPDDERYFKLFRNAHRADLIAAFHNKRVIGVMLVQRPGRDVFLVGVEDFAAAYGAVRGRYLYAVYRASQLFPAAGDRYVSSIWVDRAYRDVGIGAALLARGMRDQPGRWSVNARRGGSERFFAQAGFAPRRGPLAALVRLVTGCAPMERRASAGEVGGPAPDAHKVPAERFAPR